MGGDVRLGADHAGYANTSFGHHVRRQWLNASVFLWQAKYAAHSEKIIVWTRTCTWCIRL